MSDITLIGKTNWRDHHQSFGIKDQDRLGHIYVIGKTGTGKSTLLQNMAISDIERGNGLCIIDPHGDIAEDILNYIPKHRIKDVIYFNATDTGYAIGFNPLYEIAPNNYALVTSNLISTFKKIWIDNWGPRLEHILRYCILTLLCYSSATLLDIPKLLTDGFFRRKVLNHVIDISIINFWEQEFAGYTTQLKAEAIAPILNKIGVLNASETLRHIIGQHKSTIDISHILDTRKILICNFSKGQIGEDTATILGSILITAIQNAALQRASYNQEHRIPFYVYVDEVHSFITLSFADMLAEARKYGLGLFLAHQYIEQLSEKIQAAIFGNVGTMISFRVGATDAAILAKEFYPVFNEEDFVNLPKYSMYLKLMIDGATSKPFSANTLPLPSYEQSYKQEIIAHSQKNYGVKKALVENDIATRQGKHEKNTQHSLFE